MSNIKSFSEFYEAQAKSSIFSTMTAAIDFAIKDTEKKGYTLDDDEQFQKIGTGPKKPSEGKTNRYTLTLYKNGKEQRKALHIQIYGMGERGYELNYYIS